MSNRTVLVVEDEILIRAVLVDALLDEGYSVVEAGNVLEAIAAIGRNPPFDALVTDVDMPGCLSGLDLAEMVSSVSPRTTIIVASGRDVGDRICGGCIFLPKPYSMEQVKELLVHANDSALDSAVVAAAM